MKYIQNYILALLFFLISLPAQAIITGELIMVRSDRSFSEAMQTLKASIKKQGYIVSGVHRVDTGLTVSGYQTDKYRIVFFGKTEELKTLTQKYPELIPYLPLKIVIYAEAGETLLVTSDPTAFYDLYPNPRLREVFKQWQEDLIVIMKNVQNAD